MTVMFYGVTMRMDNVGFGFAGRWEMLPSGSANVIFISSIFFFQFAVKMFQFMALDFWMLTRTFLDLKFCATRLNSKFVSSSGVSTAHGKESVWGKAPLMSL